MEGNPIMNTDEIHRFIPTHEIINQINQINQIYQAQAGKRLRSQRKEEDERECSSSIQERYARRFRSPSLHPIILQPQVVGPFHVLNDDHAVTHPFVKTVVGLLTDVRP